LAIGMSLMRPFQISVPKGAETPIYLCSSPEVEGMSGYYFADRKVVSPNAAAQDDNAAQRLWAVSEALINN